MLVTQMKISRSLFIVFLSVSLLGASSSEQNGGEACGVIYGYNLDAKNELEKFEFVPPMYCGGEEVLEFPSIGWQKIACAYLSITDYVGEFKPDPESGMSYNTYWYSRNRPNVIYPTTTAGSSDSDPVVYVKESKYLHSLAEDENSPCHENNFKASKKPNK